MIRKYRQMNEDLTKNEIKIITVDEDGVQLETKKVIEKMEEYSGQFNRDFRQKIKSFLETIMFLQGTDVCENCIIVNETIVSCFQVQTLLRCFGIYSKPPELLTGKHELGFETTEDKHGILHFRRDIDMKIPSNPTKRQLLNFCDHLVGNFPVAAWLRPHCIYIEQELKKTYRDDPVDGSILETLENIIKKLKQVDPVRRKWHIPATSEVKLWCDASYDFMGACIEIDGRVIEDKTWRCNFREDINLLELKALYYGINLTLKYNNIKRLKIRMDSKTVCNWMNKKIRPKGSKTEENKLIEMIEERLAAREVKTEFEWVKSGNNRADELTKISRKIVPSNKNSNNRRKNYLEN